MFDTDRNAEHVRTLQGHTDTIANYGELALRIDETGQFVNAPLRMVNTEHLGIAFELGPYSISTEDAAQLREILNDFLGRARWATDTGSGGMTPPPV